MKPDTGPKPSTSLFSWLLGCFLVQILVMPLFEGSILAGAIADVAFYTLLGAAMFSMRASRLYFPSLILFFATLAGYAAASLRPSLFFLAATNFTAMGFLILVVIRITLLIAETGTISRDTILGGFCAYILIGVLWTVLYANLEVLKPGSFEFSVHGHHPDIDQTFILLYFYSFVSLLTIGYGDIVPLSNMAQSLTILEGLVGQFYLVYFISVLVGLYVYRRESGE